MQRFREMWQNMSANSKRALIIIAVLTLAAIGVGVFFLTRSRETRFKTLFTGMNQDEAQQVVGLLQEQGVEYLYDGGSGSIKVPEGSVDSLRAQLLSAGYPKSGFTYDMYINNSGLMTTESDKKQYTLYDLQDRLGATVRLFEGVRDAKVTIAEGTTRVYAIEDENPLEASASVVVTMQEDYSLNEANVGAIKNLVARSVRGMNFTNVAVFDANTMEEVTLSDKEDSGQSGVTMAQLTSEVESNIAANVKKVVGKLYGLENVAVSVKGTLDMTRLIQEVTQYTVPEKINEEDKTGLLEREEYRGEAAGDLGENAAGVVGADANADTPRYVYNNGTEIGADGYSYSSNTREWLYNVLKEQREINPGVLQDLSVAVAVDTDDLTIPEANLINLIADAAGVPRDEAVGKVTIIRAPQTVIQPEQAENERQEEPIVVEPQIPLWALIGAIASAVLLLLIVIILIIRGRRRKKRIALELEQAKAAAEAEAEAEAAAAEEAAENKESDASFGIEGGEAAEGEGAGEEGEAEEGVSAIDEDINMEEIETNVKLERGMKLKNSISEFATENPQVVAKLLQSWLREGDEKGSKRYRSTRKE